LSEPGRTATPSPEACRRLLRGALGEWIPGWQPLAENMLGADARIDLLGRDAAGRAVIALLDLEPDGDMALVAWGLAQCAWVDARLPDWAQLAPDAGFASAAGARALLLAPRFRSAALAAAAVHPDLQLLELRLSDDGRSEPRLWLESVDGAVPAGSTRRSNGGGGFRSGLSAEDLDLTPDEIAELQGR